MQTPEDDDDLWVGVAATLAYACEREREVNLNEIKETRLMWTEG